MNDDRQSVQRFEFRPVISTPSTNKTEGHIAASTEFNIKVLCMLYAQINDVLAIHVLRRWKVLSVLVKSIITKMLLRMPFRNTLRLFSVEIKTSFAQK